MAITTNFEAFRESVIQAPRDGRILPSELFYGFMTATGDVTGGLVTLNLQTPFRGRVFLIDSVLAEIQEAGVSMNSNLYLGVTPYRPDVEVGRVGWTWTMVGGAVSQGTGLVVRGAVTGLPVVIGKPDRLITPGVDDEICSVEMPNNDGQTYRIAINGRIYEKYYTQRADFYTTAVLGR